VRAGELDPGELFDAYRERAASEELNAFTWVADHRPGQADYSQAPLGGVPLAVKDLFLYRRRAEPGGLEDPRGLRPPYTATVVKKLAEAGAPLLGKTNQDEFRDGLLERELRVRAVLNPWDRTRVPGGPRAKRGRRSRRVWPRGRSGPTQEARFASPRRCVGSSASSPPTGQCSRYGMIAFASSLDPGGPADSRRHRRGAAVLADGGTAITVDSTSLEFPGAAPRCQRHTTSRGSGSASPEELTGDGGGVRARGARELRGPRWSWPRAWARPVEPCHAFRMHRQALSAYYLIAPAEASANLARYDGVRYGLRVEGDKDLLTMYTHTRAAGVRARGPSAGSCSAHPRSRAAITTRTMGPRR